MLAEFLLTPDAMSDSDDRDGADVVRELSSCFFPSRATPLTLVCKLGGSEWEDATSKRIARISNVNHRNAAMGLFQKLLSQHCISRPSIDVATDTEAGWIKAGVSSNSHVPFNNIIVSKNATPPANLGASISEFISETFWDQLSNPRLVGRETTPQEKVLRAICTHSDWLLMRLPQIRGGSDDEIVTVKQIIKLSNRLPTGFRNSFIDLHICLSGSFTERQLTQSVSNQLTSFIRNGVQIRLTVWPKGHFINRELLGGEFTKTSPGDILRRSLWWITMTHVAVGSQRAANAGEAGNTWSLFPRQKAHERIEAIESETPLHTEVLT